MTGLHAINKKVSSFGGSSLQAPSIVSKASYNKKISTFGQPVIAKKKRGKKDNMFAIVESVDPFLTTFDHANSLVYISFKNFVWLKFLLCYP